MPDREKSQIRQDVEGWFFWWRIGVTVFAVLVGAWVQVVGPGVREVSRNFLGVTELGHRLTYIETTVAVPEVIDWIDSVSGQIGPCSTNGCLYRLVASRTSYGESCGKPTEVEAFIRTSNGRQLRITFGPDWKPIELTRDPEESIVSLKIPIAVKSGSMFWRLRALYPNCDGPTEPVPRFSPWFPLTVYQEVKK